MHMDFVYMKKALKTPAYAAFPPRRACPTRRRSAEFADPAVLVSLSRLDNAVPEIKHMGILHDQSPRGNARARDGFS